MRKFTRTRSCALIAALLLTAGCSAAKSGDTQKPADTQTDAPAAAETGADEIGRAHV